MSILVQINHKTEYRFDRLVNLAPHTVRLRPAAHCRTPIRSYSLRIEPEEHFINWQQDPFGNYLARLVFPEKTRKLSVEVDVVAEMVTINPFDFFVDEYAYDFPFQYDAQLTKELAPYLQIKEQGPLLKKWLSGVDRTTPARDGLLPGRHQQAPERGYRLHRPHGAGHPDLRADARACQG
jgi:transglutaminase-like putative cysteine protease